MKTRTGFVSNSSSSSFVILGCPMTELPSDHPAHQDGWDWADSEGLTYHSDAYVNGKGCEVIGAEIVEVGEYSEITGKTNMTMRQMCEKAVKVADKLGVDPEVIRFMVGSYSC